MEQQPKAAPAVSPAPFEAINSKASNGINVRYTEQQNYTLAACDLFNRAFDSTLWENRASYQAYYELLSEMKNTAIEAIPTVEGIERLYALVFQNAVMREFVQALQVKFCMMQGDFNTKWVDLIATTAMGLTHATMVSSVEGSKNILIPEEIVERTHNFEYVKNFMLSNTWFTMTVLIILWGKLYTYEELKFKHAEQTNR